MPHVRGAATCGGERAPRARRWFAAGGFAALAACHLAPLDYTGKSCPCPEPGWRCGPEATCVPESACWRPPTYPLADPPPGFDGITQQIQGPLLIDARYNGQVISDLAISNPSGPCVVIGRSSASVPRPVGVTLRHLAIGPCRGSASGTELQRGYGVLINGNASDITLEDSFIHDTDLEGVALQAVSRITIRKNQIVRTQRGVGVYGSQDPGVADPELRGHDIDVSFNAIKNVTRAGTNGGELISFYNVTGSANRAFCNSGENEPGMSAPDFGISLAASGGVAGSPLVVQGNRILGSPDGTAGLRNDAATGPVTLQDNVLVDTGLAGVVLGQSSETTVQDNLIVNDQRDSVGMSVDLATCTGLSITGNRVRLPGAGAMTYTATQCQPQAAAGISVDPELTARAIDEVPAVCLATCD